MHVLRFYFAHSAYHAIAVVVSYAPLFLMRLVFISKSPIPYTTPSLTIKWKPDLYESQPETEELNHQSQRMRTAVGTSIVIGLFFAFRLLTTFSQGAYVIPWDFYGESNPPTQMC